MRAARDFECGWEGARDVVGRDCTFVQVHSESAQSCGDDGVDGDGGRVFYHDASRLAPGRGRAADQTQLARGRVDAHVPLLARGRGRQHQVLHVDVGGVDARVVQRDGPGGHV